MGEIVHLCEHCPDHVCCMYPEVEEGLVEHDSLDPLVGRELEWVSETFFY